MFHRAELHDGLIELAVEHDNKHNTKGKRVNMRTSSENSNINCEEGTLTVTSGGVVSRDMLVIADGAHVSKLYSPKCRSADVLVPPLFTVYWAV